MITAELDGVVQSLCSEASCCPADRSQQVSVCFMCNTKTSSEIARCCGMQLLFS